MKTKRTPFHTLLISIYPIVFLVERNLRFIPINQAYRSMLISLSFALLLLTAFWLILRNWEKAGLICSLLLGLFYSYGHLLNKLDSWAGQVQFSSDVDYLAWIWMAIFIVMTFIIIKTRIPAGFSKYLNILCLVLFILPLGLIAIAVFPLSTSGWHSPEILSEMRGERLAEFNLSAQSQYEKPDIYYIILDGYERSDKLAEHYDYDNSQFIASLEQRNFYIVSSSRSNYLNTTYSLNTSLNMIYYHEFPQNLFFKAFSNLNTNHVTDFLREQGYQIVVFQSGTGDSDDQYADMFVSSPVVDTIEKPNINPFEQLLIRTTMGVLLVNRGSNPGKTGNMFSSSINRELSIRRERIQYAFEHLPDYAGEPGNFFIFAHIYLPHIPFLYGPRGEPLRYHEKMNLYWYEIAEDNYQEYYGYQIDYLNKLVLVTIDEIMSISEKPFIIILQADHGDNKYLDWNEPDTLGIDIRSAILNAIYFSDHSYQELYTTMTPVNTFRVIFNHWFGTRYPLLLDNVFTHEHTATISPSIKPKFTNACIEFNICLPVPK